MAAGWSASTGSPCRPNPTATRSPTAATTSPTPTSSVSAGAAAEGAPGARGPAGGCSPGPPAAPRRARCCGRRRWAERAAKEGLNGERLRRLPQPRGAAAPAARAPRGLPAVLREPRIAPALRAEPRAGGVRRCPGRPKCPGV